MKSSRADGVGSAPSRRTPRKGTGPFSAVRRELIGEGTPYRVVEHLLLHALRRPRALVEREQGPAPHRAAVQLRGQPGPPPDERPGRRALPAGDPARHRPLRAEPLAHTLHVLGALQPADELGAAVTERFVIDRPRALGAEQAADAVL